MIPVDLLERKPALWVGRLQDFIDRRYMEGGENPPRLLGLDAWKFSFAYQGLQQRLIGPEGDAQVRHEILA